jgi:uncharacterized protein (DUF1015 family)
MVEIAPFPAVRYNLDKLPHLSGVIAPPYDIISVPEYHKLLARHPENIVRIELPAHGKHDRYQIAARRWQNKRFLIREKEPAFRV